MPTPATDGAFQINDVAPGTYDVTFRGAEFADLIQHEVKIEPGKATDLGTVTVTRGRKLIGLGAGKPPAEFTELAAGSYSICAIPITGDMNDRQFIQRVQENTQVLKVVCKPVRIAASPAAQTLEIELPAMTPLPAPAK